jgi:PPOX class probable F420-dependent enzyme
MEPTVVKMSTEEWKRFVLEKPRPAVAAVTRANGSPHATPVWIDLDGDEIVFMTGRDSLKGRALVRDPRICLVIQDDVPPFSFVAIVGVATMSEELDELRLWAGRLGARYMGADQADAYAARNGVPGELLVRVNPQRVTAERDIAL